MTRVDLQAVTRIALVASVAVCLAAPVAAQGRVRGLVRDRDGQGVEGARISAESLGSQASQTATSDDAGRFSFIGLDRGEWLFVIRADGFEPVQGFVGVRASGPATRVQFTMDRDLFNPPAPSSGILAGVRSGDLIALLDEADQLFDAGNYDDAIDAYRALLEQAPSLTSVHLSIGHAFRAKEEPAQALAAYRQALDSDPSSTEAQVAIDGLER